MKFTKKIERRAHIRPSDGLEEWDYGLRFIFKERWTHVLVGTEFGDFADIYWRSNTRKGEEAIKIVVWMDLGEDERPSGRTVQEYYDTNELVEAFKWLADNTH